MAWINLKQWSKYVITPLTVPHNSDADQRAALARARAQQPAQGHRISDNEAFDLLCAMCLRMEKFPQDILNKGRATGWFERIKMQAALLGWDINITIKDKGEK